MNVIRSLFSGAADLGYLAVRAAAQAARGQLVAGATSMEGGRLGSIEIRDTQVLLGPPLRFTRANIDQFDF